MAGAQRYRARAGGRPWPKVRDRWAGDRYPVQVHRRTGGPGPEPAQFDRAEDGDEQHEGHRQCRHDNDDLDRPAKRLDELPVSALVRSDVKIGSHGNLR
jgi:hypothetical protein